MLQEFLSSPIPTQRFAAVRALNEVVTRFPYVVAPCRADLEHLITDANRTTATLAITALLKVCSSAARRAAVKEKGREGWRRGG